MDAEIHRLGCCFGPSSETASQMLGSWVAQSGYLGSWYCDLHAAVNKDNLKNDICTVHMSHVLTRRES
jgi:hypothetical protein